MNEYGMMASGFLALVAAAGVCKAATLKPPHQRPRLPRPEFGDEPGGGDKETKPRDPSYWQLIKYKCRLGSNPLEAILKKRGVSYDGHYHIGVTGPQGSGKTTLVGFLRQIFTHLQQDAPADDPGAFLRGFSSVQELRKNLDQMLKNIHSADDRPTVDEDRRGPTPYIFGNVVLWDFPGVGTPRIPTSGYVNNMGLLHLSSVILVVGESIHEAAQSILDDLHANYIKATVIKTHMDIIAGKILHTESYRDTARTDSPRRASTEVEKALCRIAGEQRVKLRSTYSLNMLGHEGFVLNAQPKPQGEGEPLPSQTHDFDLLLCFLYIIKSASLAHDGVDPARVQQQLQDEDF